MGKKNKKKVLKIVAFILLALIISLSIIIVMQMKLFEKKTIISFEIKDECSWMMNHILYVIKNDAICETMCKNECNLRKKDFVKSEFTKRDNSCNKCVCSCE